MYYFRFKHKYFKYINIGVFKYGQALAKTENFVYKSKVRVKKYILAIIIKILTLILFISATEIFYTVWNKIDPILCEVLKDVLNDILDDIELYPPKKENRY